MNPCPNCSTELEPDARFCSTCGIKIGDSAAEGRGLLGTTLNGKYRVISELGSGAVGTVYLGEHLSLKKQVALKVLHSDLRIGKEALVRFQREGIAAGKFNHAGAIQIFDFDVEGDSTWYLAMEYVEGMTLKQYVTDKGALEIHEALDLAEQILSVLAEAHRQSIIHRDLKPENIMIGKSATGESTIKVLDFGLSKLLDKGPEASMMTQTGQIMGTPMYMSPEQCSGKEVDHRSDLYAAGLVFYELLSGEPPYQASNLTELLVKQVSEDLPSIVDAFPEKSFPADVDEILERALQKDPDDRFASASDMLIALEAVDLEKIGKASKRRDAGRTRMGGGRRRRRAAGGASERSKPQIAGIATVLILALAGLAYVLFGGSRPDYPRLSMHAIADLSVEEKSYVDLLNETRSFMRKREFDEALGTIGDAIAMPCSDSEAFLLRGRIYNTRGDLDTAAADFQEALNLDPGYALARASQGWIALDGGDRAGAAEEFEKAIELDPDSASALAGDGAMQFEDGQLSAAEELLRRAVGLDPETHRGQEYLGRTLLAMDDLDGAIEAFVQAKRQDALGWQAPVGLGEAYYGKGRFEEAERQLTEAVDLAPTNWELRLKLATLFLDIERFEDAAEQIRVGLERNPGSARLHVLNGLVLHRSGSRFLAIEQLERGIELGEVGFEERLLCGILLQAEGRSEEALPHFAAAIAQRDDSVEAHTDYGLALASLGRYEEAVIELEQASELDPDRLFLRITLGVIYMSYVKDDALALEHLQAYQSLGGDDERVSGWVSQLQR